MNPIIASTFVALSALIAICVTYTTIALARRVKASKVHPSSALGWLFVGGIAIIGGNWTLHAIDALSSHKPIPLTIDARMGVFVVLTLGLVGWATVAVERVANIDIASIGGMLRSRSRDSSMTLPLSASIPPTILTQAAARMSSKNPAVAAPAGPTPRPVAVPSTYSAPAAVRSASEGRRSGRHRSVRRILYIEDTGLGANTTAMREIFAHRPEVELIAARPGSMALDSARLIRPSIILLDLQRPEISSELLLRQLRRSPDCGDVPVVALTHGASEEQIDRILAGGAYAHVSRPLDVEHFMEILDRVFAVRQVA